MGNTKVYGTKQGYWNLFVRGKAREADGIMSICTNFAVFSFVTAYSIKKFVPYSVGLLLLVSKTSKLDSLNSLKFRNIWIYAAHFLLFLKLGCLQYPINGKIYFLR